MIATISWCQQQDYLLLKWTSLWVIFFVSGTQWMRYFLCSPQKGFEQPLVNILEAVACTTCIILCHCVCPKCIQDCVHIWMLCFVCKLCNKMSSRVLNVFICCKIIGMEEIIFFVVNTPCTYVIKIYVCYVVAYWRRKIIGGFL